MDIYCTKDVLSTRGWLTAVPKLGELSLAVMEGSCWSCCSSAWLNVLWLSDQCFPKGTIDHLLCLFTLSRQVCGTCGSGICGLGAACARQALIYISLPRAPCTQVRVWPAQLAVSALQAALQGCSTSINCPVTGTGAVDGLTGPLQQTW